MDLENDKNVWSKIHVYRAARRVALQDWWKRIETGTFVRVAFPIAPLEKTLIHNIFKFLGYSVPHSYARCEDANGGIVLIHPEALERVHGQVRKFGKGTEALYLPVK